MTITHPTMASTSSKRDRKVHLDDPDYLITFGVITVSDSCFFHAAEDTSGSTLVDLINNSQQFCGAVCKKIIVSDDIAAIKNVLEHLSDEEKLNVILTTGGTGFSARDVTPEATEEVIERHAPALMTAITLTSLKMHCNSMLSRAVCGIRKKSVIINLPGSTNAVRECFDVFCPVLRHAVKLLRNMDDDKEKLTQMIKNNLQDLIFINKSELSDDARKKQLDRRKEVILNQLEESPEKKSLSSRLETQNSLNREQQAEITSTSKVKVGDVASRPRTSPYEMKTMDEAFACVEEHWQTIGYSIKTVNYDNLHELVGYVLAEDVYSLDALPPFPASIKDGYAVKVEDGKEDRKVLGTSTAGSHPEERTVVSGTCVRINTGAPVPSGANAIIQIEDTQLLELDGGEEVKIKVLKSPTLRLDIRETGSDINIGDKVFSKNCVIGPGEIATAATIGHVHFRVYNKPTVAVLTTGNEIVEPWKTPRPGQIRDSNKSGLLALFRSHGFFAQDTKIASDDPDELLRQLKKCLGMADVLVITGGVSMGEKDYVKDVLERDLGVNIHFGRLFMKPGKPTTFGSVMYENKKRLIFGLPGNPVSAMVTANLFVLPTLRALSGHPSPHPTTIKASFGEERKLDPRPEYIRVRLQWHEDKVLPVAIPTTSHQISSNISSMVGVNGLAMLPTASQKPKIEKGSTISVLVIDRI